MKNGDIQRITLGDALQHVDVEGLSGHDALELSVFLPELLQSLGVVGPHVAVLIPPAVPGRLGNLEMPADLGHVVVLVEQPLASASFLITYSGV
jgi:hypothetical protein